ncbi:hypothetical protein [uncultured Algibacter sp.]|uniref:hypothetical protein n=1 Tax=uncultured Algibacter sp. TaxID=298659 RepID=UPI002638E5CC|nr:hypothetical protein [uncultured Algibacter sp.]
MLKQIKTYFEYGNHFCGIEHATLNGNEICFITQLKKNKNSLDRKNTFEEFLVKKAISNLPKNQHISLIINNDNVLSKQIESSETDTFKVVYKVFPNINLDDFYFEVIKQGYNQFVSICRKTYVQKIVDNYKPYGFSIINITLGNGIVSGISSFLKSENITTSNANIHLDNQTIITIKKIEIENTINYDINGLEISNKHVLSCCGALNSQLNRYHPITNFDKLKTTLENDYKQSRFYSLSLKSGLALILTTLLINFLIFNHYFNKVKTLQQTSQINQTTKQKIIELNENVSKSKKMVEDMLKGSSSKSSFYINTIVQGLPNSILLSELNYQPVLKRIKAEQPISIDKNMIILSGISNISDTFSNWLADLENTNWINRVEILNYEDYSKSSYKFSLKLNISND